MNFCIKIHAEYLVIGALVAVIALSYSKRSTHVVTNRLAIHSIMEHKIKSDFAFKILSIKYFVLCSFNVFWFSFQLQLLVSRLSCLNVEIKREK